MHEAYPHLACCFMLLDHEDYPHLAAFADCMHSTRPCLMLALKMKYYFETYTASSHAYFHPFNVAIFIIYYIRIIPIALPPIPRNTQPDWWHDLLVICPCRQTTKERMRSNKSRLKWTATLYWQRSQLLALRIIPIYDLSPSNGILANNMYKACRRRARRLAPLWRSLSPTK